MRGAIPPSTQYIFKAWYLIKHRDNFTVAGRAQFTSVRKYHGVKTYRGKAPRIPDPGT